MEYLALVLFLHLHCFVAFLGDVNAETVQKEEETGITNSRSSIDIGMGRIIIVKT